ncbi:MAG: hypothetical protein ABFD89_24460 [Bryobacteraceae bacterium]
MSEFRNFLSNDSQGITELETQLQATAITLDADVTDAPVGFAPYAGKITKVWLAVGQIGQDGTNAASLAATVKKNGTAICTTDPALAKAAGTGGGNTLSTGAGITQAVIKSDGTEVVAAGDQFTVTWDVTRTASTITPEFANGIVMVAIKPYAV